MLGVLALALVQRVPSAPRAEAVRTYRTAVGQRATLTLADGSRVVLAPQSELRLPAAFGTTTRTLELRGEAYFDVRTATGTPFIVRTERITTRVLGTTFSVRRYPSDTETRVVVTSGKVVVGSGRASHTLVANGIGVATDSNVTDRSAPDAVRYTEWTRGRIVFERMPVATLLATLSRWYGYDFKLADSSLARRRVTGEFRADELAETLTGLKGVLGVTLTFEGKTVTLHLQSRPALRLRERQAPLSHSTEVGR